MNPFFEKVVPLLLAFGLGIGAKQLKLLKKEDAQVLLKFVLPFHYRHSPYYQLPVPGLI